MTDFTKQILAARKAGYSDDEIVQHLGEKDPRVVKAREAGYGSGEIIAEMARKSVPDAPKARSGIGALDRSVDRRMAGSVESQRKAAANSVGPKKGVLATFGEDLARPVKEAYAGIGSPKTLGEWTVAAGLMGATPQNQLRGLALAASPVAGLTDAVVARPLARAAQAVGIGDEEGNADYINTVSLAAAPRAGALGKVAVAPAKAEGVLVKTRPPRPGSKAAIASDMRVEADRLRAAGVEPTLTDVAGEKGRRVIRAAGTRYPEAGEILQNRSRAVSADVKPAAMARTSKLVDDPRSAAQASEEIATARDEAASVNFAGPYAQTVNITPEVRSALTGAEGQAAIQRALRAAEARRDTAVIADLKRLQQSTKRPLPGQEKITAYNVRTAAEPPLEPVSGAALHRIEIAMRERAAVNVRKGSNDIASGIEGRKRQITEALESFDGLKEARADYRNKSIAMEALEKPLDPLTTDPRDYAAWVEKLPPEAQEANRLAIRQKISDRLGKQGESGFGTLDQLESSQYAQANMKAAFGDEADGYLGAIRAHVQQARNASFVAPNSGSRTAVLESDMANGAMGLAKAGMRMKGGDFLGPIVDYLASRGINAKEAQALAEAASDPKLLDVALDAIEHRLGKSAARDILSAVMKAAPGSVATSQGERAAGQLVSPE